MQSENDLIQKLMISKKIMEKHNTMGRGQSGTATYSIPEVQNFDAPQAKYDIPQDLISESQMASIPQTPKMPQVATKDRIMSSKLPDEIKMLMIEHPIEQPNAMTGPSLSDDLVEKASRLMNLNAKGEPVGNPIKPKKTIQESVQPSGINPKLLKKMIRETIEEVLSENGLLVESTSKANEVFSFRVGEHIFEGKLTKIKKIAK
jgi:hypothetical protein